LQFAVLVMGGASVAGFLVFALGGVGTFFCGAYGLNPPKQGEPDRRGTFLIDAGRS
jgi:hypothetical protein